MKVFRYWAKREQHCEDSRGKRLHLVAWGGSNVDAAEAAVHAQTKLERWAILVPGGIGPFLSSLDYAYGEADAMREDLLDGKPVESGFGWAVTRMRYGAEVLNATQLAILDIDHRDRGFFGWLRATFTPRRRLEAARIACINAWIAANPDAGLRLYRTRAGLRAILTHQRFEPDARQTDEIMQTLGVDPLYARLCRRQRCFRARLTAKPWRVDCHMARWTPLAEGAFRSPTDLRWLDEYTKKARGHAACAWIADFGRAEPAGAQIATLIALHDERSGALSGRPLA